MNGNPISGKSTEYMEGYYAYMSWYYNKTPRPTNPYQLEADGGDTGAYDDWQNGWDDASFDV